MTDEGNRQVKPAQDLQRGFDVLARDRERRRNDDRAVHIAGFHALIVLKFRAEVVVRVADDDALAVFIEAIGDLLQELCIVGIEQVADDHSNGVRTPLFRFTPEAFGR